MASADTSSAQAPSRWPLMATVFFAAVVVLTWGSNYPLLKLAFADMPPLTFGATRLIGGVVVILLLIWWRGEDAYLPVPGERLSLALIAILQFSSVLGLAGIALLYLPAGRTVTVVYSMPLWAALFSLVLEREWLSSKALAGIVISFAGLLLFVDPDVIDLTRLDNMKGMLLVLAAAVAWGLGAALYGRRKWQTTLMPQTAWQLLSSGLVLCVLALFFEQPLSTRITPSLSFIMLWNWVGPTALAVWAWSRVLSRLPPAVAGQLLMSTPFVGIGFSAVIFNESLPPVFGLSALLIAVGGMLVLLPGRTQKKSPQK